jgi:hypothetical protein
MKPMNGMKARRRCMILPEIGAIDGRTRPAMLYREVAQAIAEDRGGAGQLSRGEMSLVRRAAGLEVVANAMELHLVNGEEIDVSAYAMVCARQCRVLATLGLARRARDVSPPDPLKYAQAMAEAAD